MQPGFASRPASGPSDHQSPGAAAAPLLKIENLSVEIGGTEVLDRVNLEVRAGDVVALVGESGSGKSVTSLSIMRLLPQRLSKVTGGRILFAGRDLLELPAEEMREIRGREISMIFQEPMTSLNPLLTIGYQLMEPLKIHLGMNDAHARTRAVELLEMVGIPDPHRRLDQYPHQFSGGMRQRAMIAIGLSCQPKLIIADEPTTALDVTIQAQILELMKGLSKKLGVAMILVTHNLGIVSRYADRAAVMYAGQLVEVGSSDEIFKRSRHLYTMGLLRSVPRLDRVRSGRLDTIEGLPPRLVDVPKGCRFAPRCPARAAECDLPQSLQPVDNGSLTACCRSSEIAAGKIVWLHPTADAASAHARPDQSPMVSLKGLSKQFSVSTGFGKPRGQVKAVQALDLDIFAGETLGLVGESGCGKSTIGRLILELEKPSGGSIEFRGKDLSRLSSAERRDYRRKVQVIFQDPFSSLNPRMTIGKILREPLEVFNLVPPAGRDARVRQLLGQVGLRADMHDRYPHQLSGGQRQRVGIGRALAFEPEFIVCDEAVSALDVSVQGQIVNLLARLQADLGLTYLFIGHDLAVVRHISTRVVVMYLGRVMEIAERDDLYGNPRHPYTKLLLSSAPVPDPELEKARTYRPIRGDVPSPLNPPPGCVFSTRCPMASRECMEAVPELRAVGKAHLAACIKL